MKQLYSRPGRKRLAAALIVAAILISNPSIGAPGTLGPGNHAVLLDFGGLRRSYIVHLPPQSAATHPLPVVLNFHGGGSNATVEEEYTRMDAAADDHGFIAVYPNGTGSEPDVLNWNGGQCCADAMRNSIDDVGFTRAVLDDLCRRAQVDLERIYATGISAGGMMAYRLGVELTDRIAAIAPVDAVLFTKTRGGPSRPVPLMAFNSVDDEYVPYNGGFGKGARLSKTALLLPNPSVDWTIAQWRGFNKCSGDYKVDPEIRGGEGSPDATHSATRYTWGQCARGTEIVLWKLAGSGHVWPGAYRDARWISSERSTRVVSANEQMWLFFTRFALPRKEGRASTPRHSLER